MLLHTCAADLLFAFLTLGTEAANLVSSSPKVLTIKSIWRSPFHDISAATWSANWCDMGRCFRCMPVHFYWSPFLPIDIRYLKLEFSNPDKKLTNFKKETLIFSMNFAVSNHVVSIIPNWDIHLISYNLLVPGDLSSSGEFPLVSLPSTECVGSSRLVGSSAHFDSQFVCLAQVRLSYLFLESCNYLKHL